MTRKTERERATEKDGTMLLERASGTVVERGNAVEPRCFSERTEKVISIGLARGGRGKCADRKREKEGKRRFKERLKDGVRGRGRERARWIGEGRRQPARRMPLLAAARFWDRLGSVESGQPSGRRHSSSRCSRSVFFRGLTSCSVASSCFVISSLPSTFSFCLGFRCRIISAVVRGLSSSPDNVYPEARARARVNPLCCS